MTLTDLQPVNNQAHQMRQEYSVNTLITHRDTITNQAADAKRCWSTTSTWRGNTRSTVDTVKISDPPTLTYSRNLHTSRARTELGDRPQLVRRLYAS
ncbi:hypothetical protein [Dactylosporangium salmoneum]|uniref:Uncharacterized protein n=1 Tax=Dactylosporangium salmoneum TaxID=53361 RepID=A0ABP5UAG0_9ACTN